MATNTIIILLPGTTGTTLDSTGGQLVWGPGGEVVADAKAGNVAGAEAALEGSLVPEGPGASYDTLETYFESNYGFTPNTIKSPDDLPSPLTGQQLLAFAYDWRLDNTSNGQLLQQVLTQIDTTMGSATYEVWLLGHSMGGLVARAALEPKGASEQSWFSKVQGLVTLGTPHLGAPLALQAILNQLPQLPGLSPSMYPVVVQFVNDNAAHGLYDSTYELLPPPRTAFITVQPTGTKQSAFDLDSQIVSAGGSPANFAGALNFFTNTLSYNVPTPKPYYCAYGIVEILPTPVAYTYDSTNEHWTPVAKLGNGDLIVPVSSAQFLGSNSPFQHFIGVDHLALVTNTDVLKQAATWMRLTSNSDHQ